MATQENLSVKKNVAESTTEGNDPNSLGKLTVTWANASLEFFADVLEASADSTRKFVKVVDCDKVTLSQFPGKFVNGIAEGNVTFFKRLSESSRKFNESVRQDTTVSAAPTVEVDYERLAKMVAAELRKHP